MPGIDDSTYYTTFNAGPMRTHLDHSRRGTTVEWALVGGSLIPGLGQICKDTTLHTVRVGDGVTPYASLPDDAVADLDGGSL